MPDWIPDTLIALPALIWMIVGLGLPWTLVLLPRRDWADRVMVACLSLAFGPALLTAWMFILGTLGQNDDPNAAATLNPMQTYLVRHLGGHNLMRPDLILIGTLAIALIGALLAWRKARATLAPSATPRKSFARDERILLFLIVFATVARWIITSWLPFGAYDPLWVYGYQGRIYTLAGYIPADIGYYPQFLPLQYAYTQIVAAGEISDQAARAVLPFLQIGTILATYLLGSRLFNRRTGIIAAALWALYPHFGYWTRVGDLETPLAFGFTGAAAFFLMAWTETETNFRRRYALIAGLFLGVAMWTKPTAGAFILGVVLLVAVDLIRARAWLSWRPRLETALITGLACLPLGSIWYLRNLLIGHDPIIFPDPIWRTRALRSGADFGWPLLALTLLLAYVYFGPHRFRPNRRAGIVGVVLVILGVGPTILEPARIDLLEWLALVSGIAILTVTLAEHALVHLAFGTEKRLGRLFWALLLALPYFIVWFYSYTYHYRLSFAIVPLLILPSAVVLADWLTVERVQLRWKLPLRMTYLAVVFAIGFPGLAYTIYDEGLGWDWLWTIPAEGNYSKAGLLGVVDSLQDYRDTHDQPMVVSAPGSQALPFFFPDVEIRVAEIPYETNQLAGVTHFVDSGAAQRLYGFPDPGALQNQWYTSLFRENVTRLVNHFHDFNEVYTLYELHIDDRFLRPDLDLIPPEQGEVVFAGAVRYLGHNIERTVLAPDSNWMLMLFEVLAEIPDDYSLYVHLIPGDDLDREPWTTADGPVRQGYYAPTYYSTRFWEPGEYIIDRRIFWQGNPQTPPGDNYRMRVGFYRLSDGYRLPVTINGQPAGDGYLLETVFSVAE